MSQSTHKPTLLSMDKLVAIVIPLSPLTCTFSSFVSCPMIPYILLHVHFPKGPFEVHIGCVRGH